MDASTMFRATVASNQSDSLTLAISGSVSQEALPEVALLIDHGRRDHERVMLDLSDVRPVTCPVYIRRWIVRDTNVDAEQTKIG